ALDATPPRVDVEDLRTLCDELAAMPLSERQRVPGLPAARADVFPTALATLVAVAETGGFSVYRHSLYNLRFGLAAQLLDEPG
ncbi:MAG TPA: phosphatase, partial [Opitutus sp.]|nr:phosphatase [Opitutus sp.]